MSCPPPFRLVQTLLQPSHHERQRANQQKYDDDQLDVFIHTHTGHLAPSRNTCRNAALSSRANRGRGIAADRQFDDVVRRLSAPDIDETR